jgi:RecA-family ATPase
MHNGAWLNSQQFPPLQYAVPELLPEGLVVLAGPPKIGKSWLIHHWALECARGGKVFGQKCNKRHTLYLALEDGHRRIQTQCHLA